MNLIGSATNLPAETKSVTVSPDISSVQKTTTTQNNNETIMK